MVYELIPVQQAIEYQLVVSIPLKKNSAIGSSHQLGVKIKNIWVATTVTYTLGSQNHEKMKVLRCLSPKKMSEISWNYPRILTKSQLLKLISNPHKLSRLVVGSHGTVDASEIPSYVNNQRLEVFQNLIKKMGWINYQSQLVSLQDDSEPSTVSSRWFQPIWKILVKLDHFPK